MTIKINPNTENQLTIETNSGKMQISSSFIGEIVIEGEEHLSGIGMSLNEALVLFFEQAASKKIKQKYAAYYEIIKAGFVNRG